MDDPYFFLTDELDHAILMHRDAHFSGNFDLMRAYYEKEGKGVDEELDLVRIEELQRIESALGHNLSDEVLLDHEKEEVLRAQSLYQKLRDIYDTQPESTLACKLADLILSEEEDPELERAAVVAFGKVATSALLELLSNEDLYSPLFPGYGQTPSQAALCLGEIADPRSLPILLSAMGRGSFFAEESVAQAFRKMGPQAQEFLLGSVQKMPVTLENERAAAALLSFPLNENIAKTCFQLLKDPQVREHLNFSLYLAMGCEGLTAKEDLESLKEFSKLPELSSKLVEELSIFIRE